ncbi:TetR/AcrR family transcriptional regulator [Nocardioides baekrokdamisoli]|nr:TetR family transcriptional regulator [Nocardioides baekrokdamisoli]
MARDATTTRERLLRAGEQRFARDGVAGAKLRDIVREAGQANDSAVGYHFGSRQGLLGAIAQRHVAAMDAARAEPRPDMSVLDLVDELVRPTADLLQTPEGRDFLRITEQLAGWAGLDREHLAGTIQDTVLGRQLRALEDALTPPLGRGVARARTAEFALFVTASLAQRARVLESGTRPPRSHEAYVRDLVAMLAAAVSAPGP